MPVPKVSRLVAIGFTILNALLIVPGSIGMFFFVIVSFEGGPTRLYTFLNILFGFALIGVYCLGVRLFIFYIYMAMAKYVAYPAAWWLSSALLNFVGVAATMFFIAVDKWSRDMFNPATISLFCFYLTIAALSFWAFRATLQAERPRQPG